MLNKFWKKGIKTIIDFHHQKSFDFKKKLGVEGKIGIIFNPLNDDISEQAKIKDFSSKLEETIDINNIVEY